MTATLGPIKSIGKGIELVGNKLQNLTGVMPTQEQLDNLQSEHKIRSTQNAIEEKMVALDSLKSRYARIQYRFGERGFKEEAIMATNLAQAEKNLKILDATTEMNLNSKERRLREITGRGADKFITKAAKAENRMDQCIYRSDAAEGVVDCIQYIQEDLQYLYEDVKDGQMFDTDNLAEVVKQIDEISHVLTSDINSPYVEREIGNELHRLSDTSLSLPFMEASHKLKLAEIGNRVNPVVEKEDSEVKEMRERLTSILDKDVPDRMRE